MKILAVMAVMVVIVHGSAATMNLMDKTADNWMDKTADNKFNVRDYGAKGDGVSNDTVVHLRPIPGDLKLSHLI